MWTSRQLTAAPAPIARPSSARATNFSDTYNSTTTASQPMHQMLLPLSWINYKWHQYKLIPNQVQQQQHNNIKFLLPHYRKLNNDDAHQPPLINNNKCCDVHQQPYNILNNNNNRVNSIQSNSIQFNSIRTIYRQSHYTDTDTARLCTANELFSDSNYTPINIRYTLICSIILNWHLPIYWYYLLSY